MLLRHPWAWHWLTGPLHRPTAQPPFVPTIASETDLSNFEASAFEKPLQGMGPKEWELREKEVHELFKDF